MNEHYFYDLLLISWYALAAVVFIVLFFVPAPYGRYASRAKGPSLPSKWGWIIMESPPVLVPLLLFTTGRHHNFTAVILLLLWLSHYLQRAYMFPFLIKERNTRMPVWIICLALFFNLVNGYLNGRWLFFFSEGYGPEWLTDPRFATGIVLFISGYIINRRADWQLRRLRDCDDCEYKTPRGGLFRMVSCPNYLGEIIIWCGWALATWSWAGLSFAVWTIANLAPRARTHHRWYREHLPDYPMRRKALIHGIW